MDARSTINMSSKRKVLFFALLYILFIILFTFLNVLEEKKELYQYLDQKLEDAANVVKLILPRNFHNKSMKQQDLSYEQSYENILALSEFTDSNDIIYIYTLILRDEKVLFTSSSATPEERASDEKLSFYFDHYDDVDPRVFDIFKSKEKTYLEYTDQWGTFRSVFLPSYSEDGTFYLSVADLSISHIESLLNEQIYRSLFFAFLFLLFTYPLYYSATLRLKDNAKLLREEVERQTSVLKNSQEKLVQNQRSLLQLSKENFFDEQSAFTKIVKISAKQLGIERVSIWVFNNDRTAIIRKALYHQGVIDFSSEKIESVDHPNYFKTIGNDGFISADDAHTNPSTVEFLDHYLIPNHITSMLDTPIFIQGTIIGVTCFENIGDKKHWSKEDEEFAHSISDFCAQVFLNEQRKNTEQLLSQQAHYDALTKLPNRVLFADRFSQALAHSKRTQKNLAVCFLDLDNFKPVNDTYGHELGDKLLVEVAQRIKDTVRNEDTVSRQGGDEFTLLLGDIESNEHCEQLLNRIISALQEPYLISGDSHKISASIGATLYPNDKSDLDTLVRHADHAMYQAKLSGKNQHYFFNADDDEKIVYQKTQLQEINQALINKEFQLYYQPKVNMKTGKVFGAEALIRWVHPQKGIVPPLSFLPLIEGNELEIQIGNWVINDALRQLSEWQKEGIDLEISVNISSHHIQAIAFYEQLKSVLANHSNVEPRKLQLEVLESSVLSDLRMIREVIGNCKSMLNVEIALDDFGTGYSSLTHLRNLSVDTIKIDQSFVIDMLDDPDDYIIVDGVINLSQAFNCQVIAEGVETSAHGLMLLNMGCQYAQGYGIAKPMPADKISNWLKTYKANQDWINCSNETYSEKETQLELFRLTMQRWKARYDYALDSEKKDSDSWPIAEFNNCLCGRWFKKVRQLNLLDSQLINALEQRHEHFHSLADEVKHACISANEEKTRTQLKNMNTAYDAIFELMQ